MRTLVLDQASTGFDELMERRRRMGAINLGEGMDDFRSPDGALHRGGATGVWPRSTSCELTAISTSSQSCFATRRSICPRFGGGSMRRSAIEASPHGPRLPAHVEVCKAGRYDCWNRDPLGSSLRARAKSAKAARPLPSSDSMRERIAQGCQFSGSSWVALTAASRAAT